MSSSSSSSSSSSMHDSMLSLQYSIRRNASELQSYVRDLGEWQQDLNTNELKSLKPTSTKLPPIRSNKALIEETSISTGTLTPHPLHKSTKAADAHTYDKGYEKWNSFDVDNALREVDEHNEGVVSGMNSHTASSQSVATQHYGECENVVMTRLQGNELFAAGDYEGAVQSYTNCLEIESTNISALSNRAQAMLKLRRFIEAEQDCSAVLAMDAHHAKALIRRGTARMHLTKYRSALLDFEQVVCDDDDDDGSGALARVATQRIEHIHNALSRRARKCMAPLPRYQVDIVVVSDDDDEYEYETTEANTNQNINEVWNNEVDEDDEFNHQRLRNIIESEFNIPSNCFEFEAVYHQCQNTRLRLFAFLHLILEEPKQHIASLIGHSLDGDMLDNIVCAVIAGIQWSLNSSLAILRDVAQANRFHVSLMLLNTSTITSLRDAIHTSLCRNDDDDDDDVRYKVNDVARLYSIELQ